MGYIYAIRGWLELSWPDAEFEGVAESAEQHAAKVAQVRDLLRCTSPADKLTSNDVTAEERLRAGWGFPQHDLEGTEYCFFAADVEDPKALLAQVRAVMRIDPFMDGYFSIEGEDGEQYRQWLVRNGKVYSRRQLFPDFDAPGVPAGYAELLDPAAW